MSHASRPADPFQERLHFGLAKQKEGLFDEAEGVYQSVLAQCPGHALAWHLLGIVKASQGKPSEALRCFQQSLLIHPGDPVAYHNLSNAFKELGSFALSLEASERALALRPGYAAAWFNKAEMLQNLNRHALACEAYQEVLRLEPTHQGTTSGLAISLAALCDWPGLEPVRLQILEAFSNGELSVAPFAMLQFSGDPLVHRACAKRFGEKITASHRISRATPAATNRRGGPIRVAYLSADFHAHATAYLMAQVFEQHDRSRVTCLAYSFGPEFDDPMRQRLRAAFDEFHDVRLESDAHVASLLRDHAIDIAVDLKGYTRGARTGILLRKPAPVVVNFLGYPGTMGVDAYDYVLGDSVVTPFGHAAQYAEQIVQLPHCYQPNDGLRKIASRTPTRDEEGLPDAGFVFAAFNNPYKISAEVFDVWMRLLKAIPGSVLWLIGDAAELTRNLGQAAAQRGVDPQRLVFSRHKPLEDHLARHRLADLFLDTLPINAHTTASDALWAGLPVLTCLGQTFAGRVAASLLHAAGLPELVTYSLAEYEALAQELAGDSAALQALRTKLQASRASSPLFDGARFARDLERAYEHMLERCRGGFAPASFAVSALETFSG